MSTDFYELYETVDAFILKSSSSCLWCNRLDGRLVLRSLDDLANAWEPICLGRVYGCVGKIRLVPDGEWRLLAISQRTPIGRTYDGKHVIYRIDKVLAISVAAEDSTELELDVGNSVQLTNQKNRAKRLSNPRNIAFIQTLGKYRNVQGAKGKKEQKDLEKLEKRMLEELLKMFSSEAFFYSPTGDITNTVQRLSAKGYDNSLPLWKRVDDRFFWNKHMLTDLRKSKSDCVDEWILPIIQGYIEVKLCRMSQLAGENMLNGSSVSTPPSDTLRRPMDLIATGMSKFRISTGRKSPDNGDAEPTSAAGAVMDSNEYSLPVEHNAFRLMILSRRCRHRAGTRYMRRGVDEKGGVANYVETEQIISVRKHVVSFVQIRGSIPVYWSQTSAKYRPPPKIERTPGETETAFALHFNQLLDKYSNVAVVNLVDQQGREKVMADTFIKYMDLYSNDATTYITFDFHEHCKGMHFENIDLLLDGVEMFLKKFRYCWRDSEGVLCEQMGVFRVNCMDCLDRTNVVMTALARHVLVTLMFKLGLLSPDDSLPPESRFIFQTMWANNGDAISRQYAGTAALKGDFTRTGERSMMGMMKDGYNSANRYYLSRFRDVYRQGVIDVMLGNATSEELLRLVNDESSADFGGVPATEEWTMEREESVAFSITKCRQLLITGKGSDACQGWALVEPSVCSSVDSSEDLDMVLLLSGASCFITVYDHEEEAVSQYERLPVEDIESIQIGPLSGVPKSQQHQLYLRVSRRLKGEQGYFYTFRPVYSRSPSEAKAVLFSIVDALKAVRHSSLPVLQTKLSKSRSRASPNVIVVSQSQHNHQTWLWRPRQRANANALALGDKLASPRVARRLLAFGARKLGRASSPSLSALDSDGEVKSEEPVKTRFWSQHMSSVKRFLSRDSVDGGEELGVDEPAACLEMTVGVRDKHADVADHPVDPLADVVTVGNLASCPDGGESKETWQLTGDPEQARSEDAEVSGDCVPSGDSRQDAKERKDSEEERDEIRGIPRPRSHPLSDDEIEIARRVRSHLSTSSMKAKED